MVAEVSACHGPSVDGIADHRVVVPRWPVGDGVGMPQNRGPRARWALVGAIALAVMTTSGVLAQSVLSIDLRADRDAGPALTLTSHLDRTTVAPYREEARVAAVAARAAEARLAAAANAKAKTAHARTVARNHVWIPSLHISRGVLFYPCTRTSTPANHVYRWGCAGRNNTYLLGHAWGVFKALHDAYTSGRLRKGMVAYYADGFGRVTRYEVTAWVVVTPNDSGWAIAAQARPSMTLQTCMGANSAYRLNVRLVSF
jgi:sortase (surface protein transpeptidase)